MYGNANYPTTVPPCTYVLSPHLPLPLPLPLWHVLSEARGPPFVCVYCVSNLVHECLGQGGAAGCDRAQSQGPLHSRNRLADLLIGGTEGGGGAAGFQEGNPGQLQDFPSRLCSLLLCYRSPPLFSFLLPLVTELSWRSLRNIRGFAVLACQISHVAPIHDTVIVCSALLASR